MTQKTLFKSWLIWFPAALFYCYQFILRVSPSIMADDLMRDFSIGACAFGSLTAFYYYGYCTLQIPLGLLADYFGPRKLLTFAVLLCAGATAMFATSTDLMTAQMGRLLIGVGSSCAFLGSMKLGTLWFPSKKLPLITGATIFLGTMGANFGGAPLRMLANSYNWRTSLLIVSCFGIFIGLLIWFIAKDGVSNKSSKQESSIFEGLKHLIKTPQVWLGSIYGFMLYAPLSVFADLWGASFLVKAYNISSVEAGAYVNLIYVGLAIGALAYAVAVEKFISITKGLQIATIGVGIPFTILLLVPNIPLSIMGILLFMVGIMIGGQFLSFSFTCSHMPVHFSGVTIGITNMVTMLSGVIFQPLIGAILDSFWKGELLDGVRIFEVNDYRIALSSVSICVVVAFVISLFLKEGNPQENA